MPRRHIEMPRKDKVMLLVKKYCASLLIALLISAATSTPNACAQTDKPETISVSAFREMIAGQPDFTADWIILVNDPTFGIKLNNRMKIARKQGQSRREVYPLENETRLKNKADRNYKIVLISRPGQPQIALDPQRKTYTQTPAAFNAAAFDIDTFIKSRSKEFEGIRIENVGSVAFAGRQTTGIRLTFAGETGHLFFYFAKDLNNLMIGMDEGKREGSSLTVSNISFDVPDDLFKIPQGYQEEDFVAFLETVKQKVVTPPPAKHKDLPVGIVEPIHAAPPPPADVHPGAGEVVVTTDVDSTPVLLYTPQPNYTEQARSNKIQGTVALNVLVGADGNVKQVRVLRGLADGLDEEALKTAYLQRYKPAIKKGQPVKCWIKTEIEFRLR